jgi:uncharacterized protein involved in exopolysaccharide biosynthesis
MKEAQVTGYFRVDRFSLVPEKPLGLDPQLVLFAGIAAGAALGLLLAFLIARPKSPTSSS